MSTMIDSWSLHRSPPHPTSLQQLNHPIPMPIPTTNNSQPTIPHTTQSYCQFTGFHFPIDVVDRRPLQVFEVQKLRWPWRSIWMRILSQLISAIKCSKAWLKKQTGKCNVRCNRANYFANHPTLSTSTNSQLQYR